MIYKSIILELFILLFALYSHCGDKKYELFSDHLFERAQKHGGWR